MPEQHRHSEVKIFAVGFKIVWCVNVKQCVFLYIIQYFSAWLSRWPFVQMLPLFGPRARVPTGCHEGAFRDDIRTKFVQNTLKGKRWWSDKIAGKKDEIFCDTA
jgi:hypothetical protein